MIRTLSLNTGYGMFLDDLLAYVAEHLTDTDIFCFQEVDESTKVALDTLLSATHTSYYKTKFDKEEKFLLATYISRSFHILETQTILEDIEDVGLGFTCRLEDADGRRFTVTNVHGFPRPGAKLDTATRLEQSRRLIESAETTVPHIYIGDFNLLPEARSVQLFRENGFNDLIEEFKIPTTRNEVIWKRFPDNKQLFADYAFIKNGAALDYNLKTDDIIISDHLPLLLDVQLLESRYFKPKTKLVSNSGNTEVSQVLNAAN